MRTHTKLDYNPPLSLRFNGKVLEILEWGEVKRDSLDSNIFDKGNENKAYYRIYSKDYDSIDTKDMPRLLSSYPLASYSLASDVIDTEKYYTSNHHKDQDIIDSMKQDTSLPKGSYYLYTKDIEQSLKIQIDFYTRARGYKALNIYTIDTNNQYKISYYNNPLDNIPYPKGTTFLTTPNTPIPTYHTDERVKIFLKGSKTYKDFILNLKQKIDSIQSQYEIERIRLEVGYGERKSEIDLRGKRTPNGGVVEWISQFNVIFGTLEKQKTACNRACVYILQNAGVSQIETPINNKVTYQIAIEKGVGYKERNKVYERNQNINIATTTNPSDYMQVDIQTFEAGLSYLDSELERGYPVVVGTDHHYNYNGGYNNDLSTDHFVVIVGRGYDTKGLFYRFYEVGTNREDANKKKFGISDDNKFYIENNTLQGKPAHKLERNYLVTQIRRNKTYKERK